MVVEDDVQQRLVTRMPPLYSIKPMLAKAIHKQADAGAGGADHFSEGFL